MKILVANLGSTSFKYRLFNMADERELARGGVERIGSLEVALLRQDRRRFARRAGSGTRPCGGGRDLLTASLRLPRSAFCRMQPELAAIGFKAVHARG